VIVMFNPTIIIYVYAYIIVSLIAFDIFYTLNERIQEKRNVKKLEKYKESIKSEIENLDSLDMSASKEHMKKLHWKLRGVNNLLIYQEAIKQLRLEDKDGVDAYLISCQSVLHYFANFYGRKDMIYRAFFASFLAKYYPFHLGTSSILDEAIMNYVQYNSIYCRENAMLYFYKRGSARLVVNALRKIDEENLYYNGKLLTNDLLKFSGEKHELAKLLMDDFSLFSIDFQVSIINYLRFSGVNFCEQLLNLLVSGECDKEVNLAIIRYFGKNVYDDALVYLLAILNNSSTKQVDVEYRIITAQIALAYDNSRVRNSLINCVSDANWYVRRNAAKSLSKMNLTKNEMEKLVNIEDRYGREMVKYIFKLDKTLERVEVRV